MVLCGSILKKWDSNGNEFVICKLKKKKRNIIIIVIKKKFSRLISRLK
jgi:hypothetical protein